MDMNLKKRMEIVDAMNKLVHCVNDESYIDSWLMYGVADGDTYEDFDIYCDDDENFAELMGLFLRIMNNARKDGGLYVNGVVSSD